MIGAPKRNVRRQADRDAGVKFTPLAGSHKPFKAAAEFMRRYAEAMRLEGNEREAAINAIPPLRSRGHGGKHRAMQRSVLGRAMKDRSAYAPKAIAREQRKQSIVKRITSYLVGGE